MAKKLCYTRERVRACVAGIANKNIKHKMLYYGRSMI